MRREYGHVTCTYTLRYVHVYLLFFLLHSKLNRLWAPSGEFWSQPDSPSSDLTHTIAGARRIHSIWHQAMPPELHTSVDRHSASHCILPHQPTVSLDNLATVLPPGRRADIQFMAHTGAYKNLMPGSASPSIHSRPFLPSYYAYKDLTPGWAPPPIHIWPFPLLFSSCTEIVTGAYKDTCAPFLATSSREAHYLKSSQACFFFHQAPTSLQAHILKDTCALFLVTSSRKVHYPKLSQARSFSFSLLFHQAISLQSCIEPTVSPTNLSNLLSSL